MISTSTIILSILAAIGSIAVTIIGYFLNRTMNTLDETTKTALETKSELAVLKQDHTNKHEYLTEKFDDLKESIVVLTKEIKELNSKIKN